MVKALIYIPTRGRPHVQKTVKNLLGVRPFKLVLSKDDPYLAEYRIKFKGQHIVCDATGIAATRQFIRRHAGNRKHIMLDDDLTFFYRGRSGRFSRASHKYDVMRLFTWLEKALDSHAHAGVVDKFMSTYRPRGTKEFGRYNQILGYNFGLLQKARVGLKPDFRTPVNEEHDMHLQLCALGFPPLVSHEFSKDAPYYAEGGCSMWRTKKVELRGHKEMARLHPDFVKLKDTEHAISGKRIVVRWRQAAKAGLEK